jgi:hypothetical protein
VHGSYVPEDRDLGGEVASRAGEGLRRTSIFRCWGVVSNLTGGSVGERQKQLVTLAMSLKRDAKVSLDEAMWVAHEVNIGFDAPKADSEVNRIVRWAYGVEG